MAGSAAQPYPRATLPFGSDALREERIRLAHDIHDGVLQVLTGAALQIDEASQLCESDPVAARAACDSIRWLIEAEQRELRLLIGRWSATLPPSVALREVRRLLQDLCLRIAKQWSLPVHVTVDGHGRLSRETLDAAYSMVREALANVGRHSHASVAHVALSAASGVVRITVRDDGCGFPFQGRYDLQALIDRGIGPRSLRERVSALGGDLVIVSGRTGASVEIALPREQRPRLANLLPAAIPVMAP